MEQRQFEILLDELTDAEIKILTAMVQAILDARADSNGENWIRCKECYEQEVHGVFLLKNLQMWPKDVPPIAVLVAGKIRGTK